MPEFEWIILVLWIMLSYVSIWVLQEAGTKVGCDEQDIYWENTYKGKLGRDLKDVGKVVWPLCKSKPYEGEREGRSFSPLCNSKKV